jgi:hypothetical protein
MNLTIETPNHFKRAKAGKKTIAVGPAPEPNSPPSDPIPRISRLVALTIHFDGLIRDGVVKNYADLARLGSVSRARITQIMNILALPPWKRDEILITWCAATRCGEATERNFRIVSGEEIWNLQRNKLAPLL